MKTDLNEIVGFLNAVKPEERRAPSKAFDDWYQSYFLLFKNKYLKEMDEKEINLRLNQFIFNTTGTKDAFEKAFNVKVNSWKDLYNQNKRYFVAEETINKRIKYVTEKSDLTEVEAKNIIKSFYYTECNNRNCDYLKDMIDLFAPEKLKSFI